MNKIVHKLFIVAVLILACASQLQAQQQLILNSTNSTLLNYRENHPVSLQKSVAILDTLPFIDDFSSTTILPNKKYWTDENVFINSNMVDTLLSIGIATFDAIDKDGHVYLNIGSYRKADELTSVPINLGKYKIADNLMLSFYYQAGGKLDMPEATDSLILEFFNPDSAKWFMKWFAPKRIRAFSYDTIKFEAADSVFLRDGFQFRFRNTVSIENENVLSKVSQMDLWHLDYIYFDKNRAIFDTSLHDLTFYRQPLPIFFNYSAVPLTHFKTDAVKNSELKSELEYQLRNNDIYNKSVTKRAIITDLKTGKSLPTIELGVNNLNGTYLNEQFINQPKYYTTTSTSDATFEIKRFFNHQTAVGVLKEDIWKWNDTVRYNQVMDNYYAYDDGTSEAGYGLTTAYGYIAVAFNSFLSDSLDALDIYFNDTYNNATQSLNFYIYVWDDNHGIPGKIVYSDKDTRTLNGKKLNNFIRFYLQPKIQVYGKFYVGIRQTSTTFPNIGFDLDYNSLDKIFINYQGPWEKAGANYSEINSGSLMIHTVFNSSLPLSTPQLNNENKISVYPNPAIDEISINNSSNLNPVVRVDIYNLQGQKLKTEINPTSKPVQINELKTGIYLVKIVLQSGEVVTEKLLKK